jgi:hypothetical protein
VRLHPFLSVKISFLKFSLSRRGVAGEPVRNRAAEQPTACFPLTRAEGCDTIKAVRLTAANCRRFCFLISIKHFSILPGENYEKIYFLFRLARVPFGAFLNRLSGHHSARGL